jgi:4-hydroxy-tetrahydrodipicolinate synthase
MVELVHAAMSDDWPTARRLNRQYFGLMQANFWEPSPAPVKAVMAILGRGTENLRLPMVPVSKDTRHRLEVLVGQLGLMVEAEPPNEHLRRY